MGEAPGRIYAGRSDQDRRAERRARLVEAALTVIHQEGIAGLSVDRVCRAAGLSTRSFYEEHSGREALLEAVYSTVIEEVISDMVEAVSQPCSAEDRVRRAFRGYVLGLTRDERRARVHAQGRLHDSLVGLREQRTRQTWHQLVHGWCQGSGTTCPDPLPPMPTALFRQVLGAVSEVMTHWLDAEVRRSPEDLAEQVQLTFTPVVLGGLRRAGVTGT